MKDSKDDDRVSLVEVGNYVRQTAQDQLTRAIYSARPADAGMPCKHFDARDDFKHPVDRRGRVVAADVSLDRFEILVSGARPL